MNKLKVGDVIDAVSRAEDVDCRDCIFTETTACRFDACIFGKDLILKIRTGPKQGDTVWVKGCLDQSWEPAEYIALCEKNKKHIVIKNGTLSWYHSMTTTDPYALKYTLIAQEALVAIGRGQVVQDEEGHRYKWNDDGIAVRKRDNNSWSGNTTINTSIMYAIVGEYVNGK